MGEYTSILQLWNTVYHFPHRANAIVKQSMNENFPPQVKGARNFELPMLYGFLHSDLNNY